MERRLSLDEIVDAAAHMLGIAEDRRPMFRAAIEATITASTIRFDMGNAAQSPSQTVESLERIASAADQIHKELWSFWTNARSASANDDDRSQELLDSYGAILKLSVTRLLPPNLRRLIGDEELLLSMPTIRHDVARHEVKNAWTHGFARFATEVRTIARSIDKAALQRGGRPVNADFRALIHRLGAIFETETGKPPKAPAASGNVPPDWKAPFVRFVHMLWPLLDEGEPPSARRIREALKANRTNHGLS